MNTISNGNTELLYCYNCNLEILSFGGGLKENVIIGSKRVNYVRFFISPYTYSLALEWKILQKGAFIEVSKLIVGNKGEILDKFGREKEYIFVGDGCTTIGWPNINVWYDKDLVIRKDN